MSSPELLMNPDDEFDEFWDAVMVMLNPVFGLGVAVQEYQTGGRKVGVIRIKDPVTKFEHVVGIKYSCRRWPIPPSMAQLYEERLRKLVAEKVPHRILSEADITLVICGKFTRGVTKLSHRERKTSGRSEMVYYVQKRGRSIIDVAKRIAELLKRYYMSRISRIREVCTRLEEQGLDTTRLDIAKLSTFLTIITKKLDEGIQLLHRKHKFNHCLKKV